MDNSIGPSVCYCVYQQAKIDITWGSGGGSVGRVVASTSRAPQLESNHLQNFIMNIFTTNC